MKREWHKWLSPRLGREMELLVFGHAGPPTIVFPTSCGRFYDFEDRGMVHAVEEKIERGELQLVCVDSVDAESWYNQSVGPRGRVARHVQYESYVMEEVVPLVRSLGGQGRMSAAGASLGGYHAANIGLKHPEVFTGFLAMGAAFDLSSFLGSYYDDDCYFNIPMHYLPNISDEWYLDRYRDNRYVLAIGECDLCRSETEDMVMVMRAKGISVQLDVWGDGSKHDWPEWMKMVQVYL
jgi:esterase/lipase superfamily enzyme